MMQRSSDLILGAGPESSILWTPDSWGRLQVRQKGGGW